MDKKSRLLDLRKRMQEDKELPLRAGATQLVFGEGNASADLYFLGEAPGYFEDKQGRPFVGLAGQLLDKLIESIGLMRADVYISNVVRFRPPANRDPEPEELAAFAPYVDEEIKIIEPKIIVTLGRFSMNKFLPDSRISAIHGKKFVIVWQGHKVKVLPMYHPAAALRNGAIMTVLKSDFLKIKEVLNEEDEPEIKTEASDTSQLSLI